MASKHAGPCPADGADDRGRCAGTCTECGDHRLLTGRYTPYCPSCETCDECGCPAADGFAHNAGCPKIARANVDADPDDDERSDAEGRL
jgi:hypothetical protein